MARLADNLRRLARRRADQQSPTAAPAAARSRGRSGYGSLTYGGIVNPQSGMGTGLDKSEASFFQPTRITSQLPLEVLCVQSWAARNFVDYPVDDQFIAWRSWVGDESASETMAQAEDEIDLKSSLAMAMKAARQYGTGLLVMMTTEAPMDTPLMVERVREGDLTTLVPLSRFEASAREHDRDLWSPRYGMAEYYDLHPKWGGGLRVHASRVIRFDGITSPVRGGFTTYDPDWGMPQLIPVILAIMEDQTIATAIAHLSQEASIPILRVADLRAALAGQFHADDVDAPNMDQIASSFNLLKSIYRVAMLDKDEEAFERVPVQFGGLADLLDRFDKRVAAAARIPLTRWMGQSPAGMNATGDSDLRHYAMVVEAERERHLTPVLNRLDAVIARSAGLAEAPEYEWLSLLEMSDTEKAQMSKTKAEAVISGVEASLWDEDEGREMLAGDSLFGSLEGQAPELPDEGPAEPPVSPVLSLLQSAGMAPAGDDDDSMEDSDEQVA